MKTLRHFSHVCLLAFGALGAAAVIGDVPGAAQQLHGFPALVLDLHEVGPDEVKVLGDRQQQSIDRLVGAIS